MNWNAISFLFGIFLICTCIETKAQFKKSLYHEAYPELPFSMEDVKKHNYSKIIIWYDEYKKAKDDESGMIWSDKLIDYQFQRHTFIEGKMDRSTWYTPENQRIRTLQYYYIGKNISVIDDITYDSLQNEQVNFNYIYTYKDTVPFQMVKMHSNDKQFRILFDYTFDENGKLKRQQTTTHGVAKKMETVLNAEEDIVMILVDHKNNMSTKRYYKNMSELQKSVKTFVNEKGELFETNIKDGNNKAIHNIKYTYEADKLVLESYSRFNGEQVVTDKKIYYRYNDDGLLEKIITEKENIQTILSLQYYEE